MTTIPPPPLPLNDGRDEDRAWTDRKNRYREEVPYGCRRCLKAGLRGHPDLWLDCHHPWGRGNRYDVGQEPASALMWLCQEHHDALHKAHNAFSRKLRIIGKARDGSTIHHRALYSITLYIWSMVYVLSGRALLTSGARCAFYVAGVVLGSEYGPVSLLATAIWPVLYLWRKR